MTKRTIEKGSPVARPHTEPAVLVIAMDLSRSNEAIHADLRARFPRVVDLWWELEEGEQTGTVWNGNHVLARLQHVVEDAQMAKKPSPDPERPADETTYVICGPLGYYAGPTAPHPRSGTSPPKWLPFPSPFWLFGSAAAARKRIRERGWSANEAWPLPVNTAWFANTANHVDTAVEQVKRVYDIKAAISSKSQSVTSAHKQAAHSAQLAASLFADFFTETEPHFDPNAFFRACGLPDAFIEHMAKARAEADRKTLDKAWREAAKCTTCRGDSRAAKAKTSKKRAKKGAAGS